MIFNNDSYRLGYTHARARTHAHTHTKQTETQTNINIYCNNKILKAVIMN